MSSEEYVRFLREKGLLHTVGEYVPGSGIYMGIDPTHFSLHIGHLYLLYLLEGFRLRGHTIRIIIGDFTVRIGDPSELLEGRTEFDTSGLRFNTVNLIRQLRIYFPEFHVMMNSVWLGRLSLMNYLKLTKAYSLNEITKYSYFVDRIGRGDRVSLSEVNYKVLQAYDFKYLHENTDVRGQLGGSDQRNNIADALRLLDGRGFGLLVNLLTNEDGTKISKSKRGPQPFLSIDLCNHLDFYRALRGLDGFRDIYPWLGYDDHDEFMLSIMSRRDRNIYSLDLLRRRGVRLFRPGDSLAQMLVHYWNVKNLSAAKNLVRQGRVAVNGRVPSVSYRLRHRDLIRVFEKGWFFLSEDSLLR